MWRIVCSHRLGVHFVKWLPFCLGPASVLAILFVLRCFRGKVPGDVSPGGLLVSRSQFVTRSKQSLVLRAWITLWNLQVYLILHRTSMFATYWKVKFIELNFINLLILLVVAPDDLIKIKIKVEPCNESLYELRMLLWHTYYCFMASFLSHVIFIQQFGKWRTKPIIIIRGRK